MVYNMKKSAIQHAIFAVIVWLILANIGFALTMFFNAFVACVVLSALGSLFGFYMRELDQRQQAFAKRNNISLKDVKWNTLLNPLKWNEDSWLDFRQPMIALIFTTVIAIGIYYAKI